MLKVLVVVFLLPYLFRFRCKIQCNEDAENGIKFSDYTSTLKYILVFNIFCLFIFVITSTLKNHWVNNAKYLLDILEDE